MNEKKENLIKDKSFEFALQIIALYKILVYDKKEFVLSKQILRSGTAIGALVREAEHAESRADFVHKMAITQKEANETDYWLELLFKSKYLEELIFQDIFKNLSSIRKILASIIVTSKRNS